MAVVCRPTANLRSGPSTRSELLTQELFGRGLQVEMIRRDWVKCRLSDGYRGWLPVTSVSTDEVFNPTHIVVKRFAKVSVRSRTGLLLPMGSLIEVKRRSGNDYTIRLPGAGSGLISGDVVTKLTALPWQLKRFNRVLREVTGTPYLWGGKSTFGFDCSGLVQFAFGFFGRELPRDSSDQATAGRRVKDLADIRPYDLVFFGQKGKIDHVAVHLERMRILHASGYVRIESLDPDSGLFRSDLHDKLHCVRRVVDV